jgi:flagellin
VANAQTLTTALAGSDNFGGILVTNLSHIFQSVSWTGAAAPTNIAEANDLIEAGRQAARWLAQGAGAAGFTFQIGANASQQISVEIDPMNWDAISGNLEIDLITVGSDVADLLDALDDTLGVVTAQRSELGAVQNRLEFTIHNLDVASENLSAAESRIRDADMALEMMRLTQANVLQQAATAMLAQANQAPQSILQLLG